MSISEKFRDLRGDVLFHYTHEDNVKPIQANNTIYSRRQLHAQGIIPSYMTDESSRAIDDQRGYDEYVFLVFSSSHPMIYRMKKEKVPLLRCKIDVSILDLPGVQIADRIATDNSVTLYTPKKALKHLDIEHCSDKQVDRPVWDIVKKYEILIPHSINLKEYSCTLRG